jgi:hypothetical protein
MVVRYHHTCFLQPRYYKHKYLAARHLLLFPLLRYRSALALSSLQQYRFLLLRCTPIPKALMLLLLLVLEALLLLKLQLSAQKQHLLPRLYCFHSRNRHPT